MWDSITFSHLFSIACSQVNCNGNPWLKGRNICVQFNVAYHMIQMGHVQVKPKTLYSIPATIFRIARKLGSYTMITECIILILLHMFLVHPFLFTLYIICWVMSDTNCHNYGLCYMHWYSYDDVNTYNMDRKWSIETPNFLTKHFKVIVTLVLEDSYTVLEKSILFSLYSVLWMQTRIVNRITVIVMEVRH